VIRRDVDPSPPSPFPTYQERTGNPAILAKNRAPARSSSMVIDAGLEEPAASLPALLTVDNVQRLCNLPRSSAYALMHRLGPVRVGVEGSPRHRGSLRLATRKLLTYLREREVS
jgi:hypothetical protein